MALAVVLPGEAGELSPPFGLEWGGSPARLVDWAKKSELDLLVKSPGDDPEKSILMITPPEGALPGHEATSLEARFQEARLFEVGVHYAYPGRGVDFIESRFIELKRLLSVKHGQFKLAARQKDVKDGISTTSEAYHLKPAPGYLLILARTVVVDTKRNDKAMRFSVVYHCDHLAKPSRDKALGGLPIAPPSE